MLFGLFSRSKVTKTHVVYLCHGVSYVDYMASKGHIARVVTNTIAPVDVGFITLDEAERRFGKGHIEVRKASSLGWCTECDATQKRHASLYKSGNENPGWSLRYGAHRYTLMSRDSGPAITGLPSLEECRRRAELIKKDLNFEGSGIWFAKAIDPDGQDIYFRDLSESYGS